MAKKFNNGQSMGIVREMLNANADELNATTKKASDMSTALSNRPPLAADSPIKYTDIWACSQAQYDASPKLSTRRYDIFE